MMLNAIIVDDEKQLRITLKKDIDTFCESVNILGEADSVKKAVKLIDSLQPDIVFLDIHLGDGSGFKVLEQCEFKKFKTIFITAYDNYALKAFKTNALDYLLKPYSKDELIEAVNKVMEFYQSSRIPELENEVQKPNPQERISIRTSQGIEFFLIEDIVYCQSNGNYCMIYLRKGGKLLSAKTLKEYESILQPYGFLRIHHSFLVNFDQILKYSNKGGGCIIMKDDTEIPISQRRKSYVLAALEKKL